MKTLRLASLLVLLAIGHAAQAVTFTLDTNSITITRPPGQAASSLFTGTLDLSAPGAVTGSVTTYYGKSYGIFVDDLFGDPPAEGALASTGFYSGPVLTVDVPDYFVAGTYEFDVTFGTTEGQSNTVNFSVVVQDATPAVPGPAAALPFAALVLCRRKRTSPFGLR